MPYSTSGLDQFLRPFRVLIWPGILALLPPNGDAERSTVFGEDCGMPMSARQKKSQSQKIALTRQSSPWTKQGLSWVDLL